MELPDHRHRSFVRHDRTRAGRAVLAGVLLCLSLSAARPAFAQGALNVQFFRDRSYYEPLLAEPMAARTRLIVPAWADEFPHSVEKGSRFAWQISLGDELPIVMLSNQTAAGTLQAGKWGIGFWTPVSFHMIEDFKDTSNPIVDTDYRFGTMVKFQRGLTDRLRVGARFVPWAHESTHLGDEYTILAEQDPSFERINVSYEYWEYGISFEGNGLFTPDDNWTARHGGLTPWGDDGYYSNHLLGSEEATLTPSTHNYEPSFGFEYRMPEWHGRQNYFSVDARPKLIYNYHQTPENSEERQWSWNLQVGRAVPEGTSGIPLKQYFFQFYWGVNPYGQLRSQKDFWSAGLGFVFGL